MKLTFLARGRNFLGDLTPVFCLYPPQATSCLWFALSKTGKMAVPSAIPLKDMKLASGSSLNVSWVWWVHHQNTSVGTNKNQASAEMMARRSLVVTTSPPRNCPSVNSYLKPPACSSSAVVHIECSVSRWERTIDPIFFILRWVLLSIFKGKKLVFW